MIVSGISLTGVPSGLSPTIGSVEFPSDPISGSTPTPNISPEEQKKTISFRKHENSTYDLILIYTAGKNGANPVKVSYEWDFGDGKISSGVLVSHKYEKAREYIVTLSITDTRMLSYYAQIMITITDE